MATDGDDREELLRGALEDAGYENLLLELAALEEPQGFTFERLTASLEDAVVPAMRARAAAMRLLANVELRDEHRDETPAPDRSSIRVPLDRLEAERLDRLADELDLAVAGLRSASDAD